MTAPLDLDAIVDRANRAREVWNRPDTYGLGPQIIRASAADVPALIAELERLRVESVSRSALVQVGTNYGRAIYELREDD